MSCEKHDDPLGRQPEGRGAILGGALVWGHDAGWRRPTEKRRGSAPPPLTKNLLV